MVLLTVHTHGQDFGKSHVHTENHMRMVHQPRTTAIYRARAHLITMLDNCCLRVTWMECKLRNSGNLAGVLRLRCWTYDLGLTVAGATPISLSDHPGQLTETIQVLIIM